MHKLKSNHIEYHPYLLSEDERRNKMNADMINASFDQKKKLSIMTYGDKKQEEKIRQKMITIYLSYYPILHHHHHHNVYGYNEVLK